MAEHRLTQLPEGHFRCDDCGMFFVTGSEHTWFSICEELDSELNRTKRALEMAKNGLVKIKDEFRQWGCMDGVKLAEESLAAIRKELGE